jgi:hypothetical protein
MTSWKNSTSELSVAITFIKIDAECSEPGIISGGIKTISWHRPALYIEVNKSRLQCAVVRLTRQRRSFAIGLSILLGRKTSIRAARFERTSTILELFDERREDLYDVLAIAPDRTVFSRVTRFMR